MASLDYMQQQNNPTKIRKVENNINPLFVNRWSPRAMSGEEISHDDLMGLFKLLGGHLHLIIISLGGLYMP
jgi:hypothetical protein